MGAARAGGAAVLLILSAFASAGCNKSYCETGLESGQIETGDPYRAARTHEPDGGWRIRLSR